MTKDLVTEGGMGSGYGSSKDPLKKGCLSWGRGEMCVIGYMGGSIKSCSTDQKSPIGKSTAQSRN